MKICKRLAAALLVLVMLLTMLPAQAFAAGRIDMNADSSLTISYTDKEIPLVGADFSIYLVATVNNSGTLTTTTDFTNFNVDIYGENEGAWRALASTLEGYVLRDNVKASASGETNRNGQLILNNPVKGLYLVLGNRYVYNDRVYETEPFMVMVPTIDVESDEWLYDVVVKPKHESWEIPEEDETITRKVVKVWDDKGYSKQRPKSVIIQLLRDGRVYDSVKLNDDNNWRYTWKDLDDDYRWSVVEKESEELKNYTVSITREGKTFIITNTYEEDLPVKTEEDLPQTGQLWWPVPALFAGGLLLIIFGLIRRRNAQ